MSRKYCSVCKEPHQNGGFGLCDTHIEQRDNEMREAHNEEPDQFSHFMSLDDEDKWEKVFDFMRSKGWDAY